MPYVIMGFVVLVGLGGLKLYSNGDDSGYARATAEALASDKQELVLLNLENADLVNQLNLQTASHRKRITGVEHEYKGKLKANRDAHDIALDQYGNTLRVLLAEAEGNRESKDRRKRESVTAFISRAEGTEGSKLAPETTRDLELVSLDGDQATILLGLCTAIARADRE